MKRRKREDYVIGEPAVFTSVVAGPEFAAECEELEKFKLNQDEPFMYEVLRRRKDRKEQDDHDRAVYGERYEERLRIRASIRSDVFEWVKPMAENALARGFSFFRCNGRSEQLELQFADGKGAYFQRSVSLKKFADKYGVALAFHECSRIRSGVEYDVQHFFRMESLDHGMTARRVLAKN